MDCGRYKDNNVKFVLLKHPVGMKLNRKQLELLQASVFQIRFKEGAFSHDFQMHLCHIFLSCFFLVNKMMDLYPKSIIIIDGY